MPKPYIHFSQEEFYGRQKKTRTLLQELELDGLLIFKIEDMYWLTGYESDGFCIFGSMFIGTNGALTHLARPADLGNLSYSSICEDVRISPILRTQPELNISKICFVHTVWRAKRLVYKWIQWV